MSLPSAAPAPSIAVPRPQGLGWLVLLPLACLLLGQLLLALQDIVPVLDGRLADPDAYMRLNRVLDLHSTGAWYDPTYPRINPPDGHLQHWTRPLDGLLLAGAWLLQPFTGFADGLYFWGVLFSPVCLALALVALNWGLAPVLGRDARFFACLALLLQPSVMAYSSVGRPDHHAFLLLLFVLWLGLIARLLIEPGRSRRPAVAAGAIAALGIWVSIESLAFVAPGLAALGLVWLAGDARLARESRDLALATTLFLAFGLLLERPPGDLFAVENDRLSIQHVTLFLLIAGFWAVVLRLPGARTGAVGWRLAGAGLGTTALAATMLVLFPELRHGPLGTVDPLYRELRFERIVETQPLVAPADLAAGRWGEILRDLIMMAGIALPALAWLAHRLLRAEAPVRRIWLAVALALAVFLPLAAWQVRWSIYAQALLVIPYSALIGGLVHALGERLGGRPAFYARPLVMLAALFWPILAAQPLPEAEVETAARSCPLAEIAPALERAAAEPGTIMALADYGPELLWRTPHRVLSIPNHRPQPGFTATRRALAARDDATAREILARHRVDWILLCPGPIERGFFGHGVADRERTLHRRLLDGRGPAWLVPVALPADVADDARLFAFRPAADAGRGEARGR